MSECRSLLSVAAACVERRSCTCFPVVAAAAAAAASPAAHARPLFPSLASCVSLACLSLLLLLPLLPRAVVVAAAALLTLIRIDSILTHSLTLSARLRLGISERVSASGGWSDSSQSSATVGYSSSYKSVH